MPQKKLVNIAVFCSGSGSNFQAIVEALKRGDIKAEIALMVCDNPQAYALQRAKKEKIQGLLVQRKDFQSKDAYEAEIIRSFANLVEKGFIYKDLKPVNWCAQCETALAEAEVEYNDHTSPSIYVRFKLLKPEKLKLTTYDWRKIWRRKRRSH